MSSRKHVDDENDKVADPIDAEFDEEGFEDCSEEDPTIPPDVPDEKTRSRVRRELEDAHSFVKELTLDDLRGGDWFAKLLAHSMRVYVTEVDAEYFRNKYPGLPADAVADARIQMAARYAGVGGGLSAAAYTGAVAATIGSGGGASPLTLPAGGASFVVDLVYTSQLQLRLAYDLSVLYRVPLDLNDPEDLWKFIRIAIGIRAGEVGGNLLLKGVPAVLRPMLKKYFSKGVLAAARGLPYIGRHLLQRNVIKFAIPGVSIPLSSGVNYWTTRAIGKQAREVFRLESRIRESAIGLTQTAPHPSETAWVVWLLVQAGGEIHEREKLLMHHIVTAVHAAHGELPRLQELKDVIQIDEERVWRMLDGLEGDLGGLYRAGLVAAAVDGKVDAKELELLKRLADRCDVAFVPATAKLAAKDWD